MSKLDKLTALINELAGYLRRAAYAIEQGDEQRAEELIDDVAHAAVNTKLEEDNDRHDPRNN